MDVDHEEKLTAIIAYAESLYDAWVESLPDPLNRMAAPIYDVWDKVFQGGDELFDEDVEYLYPLTKRND